MNALEASYTLSTPDAPGAIAIIDLFGPGAATAVERLAGVRPDARLRLADLAGVDEGLVVALRAERCQVMPHGGMRVVHRLLETLQGFGVQPRDAIDPMEMYPEAASPMEAEMLDALARAASPAAIDILLDQPRLWREAIQRDALNVEAIERRSAALNRLIDPPTVVVVGRANVGKSTLTNLVMGRAASIVADLPGTTRDWVGGLAELPTPLGELAVRWFDTPGLRQSADPIEQRAIELARPLLENADVLIAMTDPFTDWPDATTLPREPDLWVVNKADLMGDSGRDALPSNHNKGGCVFVAAKRGRGLVDFGESVSAALALVVAHGAQPWAFAPALRSGLVVPNSEVPRRYIEPADPTDAAPSDGG